MPTPTPAPDAGASSVGLVMNLALSYLVSRSLHVATELRLADLVPDGGATPQVLATRCAADAPSLARLLRTLAAHGVFHEDAQGRFHVNAAAALLRSDAMRDGVLLCGEVTGDGSWWNAVGALRHSVTAGEPAFDRQHGVGFFDYLQRHPECAAWFDRGMACFSAAEDPAVAAAGDFASAQRVVDLGGGQGGLLAEILTRHPGMHGTLFDLAHVVADPAALSARVPHGRWSAEAGDFFERVPEGADVYLLKRILHDWGDAQCVRILRACRTAMHEGSRLLVADAVLPPGNEAHPAKVMDILMMVFAHGRERSEREFAALFDQAGLRLARVLPTGSTLSLVEALPC